MIEDIAFYSLEEVRRVAPAEDLAVISVLDRSEAAQRPSFDGFGRVLRLQFEDTAEESKLARAGQWPDEPTEEEHRRFAQGQGERVPTLTDALAIVAFLRCCFEEPKAWRIAIHCYGGISRSAAIAEWAAVRYWKPLNTQGRTNTDYANPRLLRLLGVAAGQ